MNFDPGFEIEIQRDPMGFVYGRGVFGPTPEMRSLDAIRPSLAQPDCTGPETVYCIAMDVGKEEDKADLLRRQLLYGVVTYAAGRLGNEPVRSQGHIHAVSPSCGSSTCELYEIWEGTACVYMQPSGEDDPGACYAVYGTSGDVILVPPGWVHATVNADPDHAMTFGAWCIRDFGFDYRAVRKHHGIAFFPFLRENGIVWEKNPHYAGGTLLEKHARAYPDFGLRTGVPVYRQYQEKHDAFRFVANPQSFEKLWKTYQP